MGDEYEYGEGFDWDEVSRQISADIPDDMLSQVLTPAQIRNRIMRDLVPCSQVDSVAKILGIHATSPEVSEMEHRESHSRIDAVAVLQQHIGMMSMFAAEAATGAIMDSTGEQVMGSTFAEAAAKLQPVIFMSTVAIIAELIDAGYLHLPHTTFYLTEAADSE